MEFYFDAVTFFHDVNRYTYTVPTESSDFLVAPVPVVSKTKGGSFLQYWKFFGSVIGPREVEGNLKYSKPLYINNKIYRVFHDLWTLLQEVIS